MKDESKTKKQLISELNELRKSSADAQNLTEGFQQLKESNEKFLKAFIQNSIPVGITTLKEGRFVEVSDAYLKFMGLNRDEVIGKTSREIGFITEENRSIFFNELNKNGLVENLELQVGAQSGESRYGLFNAVMMTLNKEKYLLTVMTDITDRKKAEKVLQESEEKYRNILASIEDGYFEVDLKGNLTFFNDSLCRMSGYSREEFLGLNKKQFVDEKSAKTVFEKFHQVYTTGIPSKEFEWIAISKEGTKHFLETSISLKRDSEGLPAGFYGIVRNITERRWIEEELRISEERFRLIINNSKDVIWMLNMDLQFTFISPAIEQMVGYSMEEYLKKPHDEILLPDSIVRFLDVCTEELSRGSSLKSWKNQNQSRTFETEQIKKDGAKIWVEMTITFMRDHKGKPVGILGFSRDITNRKRMEEELLKARKLESVGTLAGGIAHDFNNLLAAIQGYVEMARITLPSESAVYNYLLAAEKSTHQAAELTKRLITFAQGGQPLKNNCDISQLIKNTVLEETFGKSVEKKLIIAHDLMKAIIDESHIRQVIRNLIINATEAMPEGGLLTVRAENITVTSSNHLPLSEGPYVRISIADTGAGISVEDLPLIFDPYFSTKQRGSTKGMGLGLSVCHSIVSKHQGCLIVESAAGKGTTFNIYLPSIIEEITAKETPNQEGIPGIQKQILVMDDDAGVRDMISQLLKSMGFQVETAKDGLQTIDIYAKSMSSDQAYDMVILDLTVKGGMGGVQTMKRLLKIDPHVKAIIFSGYTDDQVIKNYSQHGFLGALTKPFTKEELHSVLEKYL